MLIGITGTLGSGKGTVVDYLKEKKGYKHFSVSGYLKSVLEERGEIPTRANLSALADELDKEYEGGVLEVMYRQIESPVTDDYILESIHRVSEAQYLRSVGAKILAVDANPKVRYERTMKRKEGEKDNVTYEEFLESIDREEEGKGAGTPHIRAVIENADFLIANNGTLADLHAQVDDFLDKFNHAD